MNEVREKQLRSKILKATRIAIDKFEVDKSPSKAYIEFMIVDEVFNALFSEFPKNGGQKVMHR